MEQSTETQFALINAKLDLLIEQRSDHEARIRVLEQAKWKLAGACLTASALAGYIVNRIA